MTDNWLDASESHRELFDLFSATMKCPPTPREMTAAELDAAFARIRKAIDAIVEKVRNG